VLDTRKDHDSKDGDEFEWSFNNRKNPYPFHDIVLKLIESPNLEYKELTKAA
jgi:hypothetical protein